MTLGPVAASAARSPAAAGGGIADTAQPAVAAQRWRPPIWLALLIGFGGLTGAAAAVLLVMLDIAGRNTYELLRETAELRIDGLAGETELRGRGETTRLSRLV